MRSIRLFALFLRLFLKFLTIIKPTYYGTKMTSGHALIKLSTWQDGHATTA